MSRNVCSVAGCIALASARNLCNVHYQRVRRHGTTDARAVMHSTPEASFAARTVERDGHLIWTGAITSDGYGSIRVSGRMVGAHRYAWEQANGPIPEGMNVDHICHTPVCVNADHLRLANTVQNMQNRSGSNRGRKHALPRNVYMYRSSYGVSINTGGKPQFFGLYPTLEEASVVAEQKRHEFFGEFAGRGVR